MANLNPVSSGKLDQVIEIVRPTVVDPEGDDIVYSVKRGGDLVKSWQVYGHEMAGNVIPLRLALGQLEDFAAATGVLPVGTNVFYEDEDGQEQRYRITAFIPTTDPFDYSPTISIGGQSAEFHYSPDLEFAPGLNQRANRHRFCDRRIGQALCLAGIEYSDHPSRGWLPECSRWRLVRGHQTEGVGAVGGQ